YSGSMAGQEVCRLLLWRESRRGPSRSPAIRRKVRSNFRHRSALRLSSRAKANGFPGSQYDEPAKRDQEQSDRRALQRLQDWSRLLVPLLTESPVAADWA